MKRTHFREWIAEVRRILNQYGIDPSEQQSESVLKRYYDCQYSTESAANALTTRYYLG